MPFVRQAQVAAAPLQGSPATIGAIDVDATNANGFSGSIPVNTINPSGQLNLASSTALEYSTGAVPKVPHLNFC